MSARTRLPRASEIVVEAVREQILSARLLERDGLVDVKRGPNGGTYVRHADIGQVSEALTLLFGLRDTTIGEFLAFRLLVEPQVAALAAEHATAQQRTQLTTMTAAGLGATTGSAEVHSLIAEACGNDVIELTVKSMHIPLAQHIRFERVTEEDRSATGRAHAKIARCIVEGDPAGARAAMVTHLEAYADYLREKDLVDAPIVPGQPWQIR